MGQTTLFGGNFWVKFSADLFCRFARCSECGVYVYRVNNELGLSIGDVVPHTYLEGKVVCMGCYDGLVKKSKCGCPFHDESCLYPDGEHFKSADFVGCKVVDYECGEKIIWVCPRFPLELSITDVRDVFMRFVRSDAEKERVV